MLKKTFHSLLAAALLLNGCASNRNNALPEASIESSAEHLSSEMEIGQKIHEQILSSFSVYTDQSVVDYLNQVSHKLSRHANRQDIDYRVTLLYSDKIYATSAPGGFIYITTAMMNTIQSEAELAAILGHEIGRLQYRDPTLSEARKKLQQVSQAGAMVSSAFGSIGALAALGFVALSSASAPRARSAERQLEDADLMALGYLVEAHLDPQAMLDMMQRFMTLKESDLPFYYDYYQARPITQERAAAIQASFNHLSLDGQRFETGFKEYQAISRGVKEIYRR